MAALTRRLEMAVAAINLNMKYTHNKKLQTDNFSSCADIKLQARYRLLRGIGASPDRSSATAPPSPVQIKTNLHPRSKMNSVTSLTTAESRTNI